MGSSLTKNHCLNNKNNNKSVLYLKENWYLFKLQIRRIVNQQITTTCPWLNQIAITIPSTAESRSALSNTITGDLPPSSKEIFLPVPAVTRLRILPTYLKINR